MMYLFSVSTGRKCVRSVLSLLLIAAGFAACSKPDGNFAFRSGVDRRYRILQGEPEFRKGQKIDWVFQLKKGHGLKKLDVMIQKKGIVWAEVESRSVDVNKQNRNIFGTLNDLDPGSYKIIVFEKDRVIKEISFNVYRDDDELDLDRDIKPDTEKEEEDLPDIDIDTTEEKQNPKEEKQTPKDERTPEK